MPDRAIRQTLRHPEHLRAFVEQVVPDLASRFNYPQARLLERVFPLEDWHEREADLVFEVPFRIGDEEQWALLLVLIEHQSDTDRLMPLRLLLFTVMYWDRQWREWRSLPEPRPRLELRPVLPIVLYTAPIPWGSTRTVVDLLGEPKEFHVFAPRWQPLIWNLAERSPETLLASASEWLKALAVMRAEDAKTEDFLRVFVQAVHDLTGLADKDEVRWADLMRMLLTWAYWRRPYAEQAALVSEAVTAQANAERQKEVKTMTSKWGPTAWEVATEQGMAKGELENSRSILRTLIEDRFGSVPDGLAQRIAEVDDIQRLRTAIRHVYHVQTVDEITL